MATDPLSAYRVSGMATGPFGRRCAAAGSRSTGSAEGLRATPRSTSRTRRTRSASSRPRLVPPSRSAPPQPTCPQDEKKAGPRKSLRPLLTPGFQSPPPRRAPPPGGEGGGEVVDRLRLHPQHVGEPLHGAKRTRPLRPASMAWMVDRDTPARSASARCVRRRRSRASSSVGTTPPAPPLRPARPGSLTGPPPHGARNSERSACCHTGGSALTRSGGMISVVST